MFFCECELLHLKCIGLCPFFSVIMASCLSDRITSPTGFSTAAPSKEITGPFKANGALTNMGGFMLGAKSFISGPNKLYEYMPGHVASSRKYQQASDILVRNAVLSSESAGEGYSVFKAA